MQKDGITDTIIKTIKQEVKVKKNELITTDLPELKSIEISKAEQIKAVFIPLSDQLLAFEERYNEIVNESEKEVTTGLVSAAKRLRLDISKIRISTEKTRKTQKEEYLRAGKAIDGVANIVKWAVVDKEKKLESIEKHFENLEKERLEKLERDRHGMLSPYCDMLPDGLSIMSEEVFDAFLNAKKKEYEDRIAAEKKAEEERIEARKREELGNSRLKELLPYIQFWEHDYSDKIADVTPAEFLKILNDLAFKKQDYEAEQERIKKENERLKREAEERARIERELEKERKEKERKERERHEAELQKEREERARIERELAEKREAEERAKAEEEARIQAKLTQGDAATVKDLKKALIAIKTAYNFKSKKNKAMMESVCVLIDRIITFIYIGNGPNAIPKKGSL
jgi:hypothetical protein